MDEQRGALIVGAERSARRVAAGAVRGKPFHACPSVQQRVRLFPGNVHVDGLGCVRRKATREDPTELGARSP
jgi:hypothetical protein